MQHNRTEDDTAAVVDRREWYAYAYVYVGVVAIFDHAVGNL